MKILSVSDIGGLLQKLGRAQFIHLLYEKLESDFKRWQEFHLSPRHALHYPHGVMELMPCADNRYYSFKYVNGHPKNTRKGKLSVVAIGMLADVDSGYPLMLCEMTLLTALRTACTAVLAASYLAKTSSSRLGIIGTGAQSEFLVTAFMEFFPLRRIDYFDIDDQAMSKFAANVKSLPCELVQCSSIARLIPDKDIIITATAAKKQQSLFAAEQLYPGLFIYAMGGDCPGKVEFDASLLECCQLFVEYLPQSAGEGEIQQCPEQYAVTELWEVIQGSRAGRLADTDIIFFDSVGFAMEDFSVLTLVYELLEQYPLGIDLDMIPTPSDPKNLFAVLPG